MALAATVIGMSIFMRLFFMFYCCFMTEEPRGFLLTAETAYFRNPAGDKSAVILQASLEHKKFKIIMKLKLKKSVIRF